MMKKLYFFLVFISILTCFGINASAQVSQVDAKLDTNTIKIGEQTHLNFTVRQPRNDKVVFPELKDTLPGGKIAILQISKPDTTYNQDRSIILVRRSYLISAFDGGTYRIPQMAFQGPDGTLVSNEVILSVQTVKVDTTKSIYDIKQPLVVSYTIWDWIRDHWVIIVIVIGVLLIIGGVIAYILTRPKKEKPVVVEQVREVPMHEQILAQLQQLKDRKLWQEGNYKLYHVELSTIIRDYLEKRYVIKTQEKTTAEIFASMKYLDIAEADRNMLRLILLLADMVKFAKEVPQTAENEQSMDNAITFVNNTKQVTAPVKPTEGGSDAGANV